MHWHETHRADYASRLLADRHYNRQKPGSPQFVPPGRCVVLLNQGADALWVTSWPYAEYVKHEWAGAWLCSIFRNESGQPASELITEALAATRWRFGDPPPLGCVTFIDPRIVPGFFRRTPSGRVLEWGYSFWRAGFGYAGWTKGGLFARRIAPGDMPPAAPPLHSQISLAI